MKAWLILPLLFYGCAAHKPVSIPTCGPAKLIAPESCKVRVWGNAVEVDCPDGAKIYHCTALKAPSPQ